MSTLTFDIIDGDFPVGVKNKTATLVTGEKQALLVDAGFTRADGHRLAAAVLDSGKELTTVFISHADPDFYWGAEVIADAFPKAEFVATPLVIDHIKAAYEGKLKAWEAVGVNRPTRLVDMRPITGDIVLEGERLELKGGPAILPDRHYLWHAASGTILGGVLVFSNEHVWTADTPAADQVAAWTALLDEMRALNPSLVIPGHRTPDAPADITAIDHTRDYLGVFLEVVAAAPDGPAATAELINRYPNAGMQIAAQIGPKVAKGEMKWG